MSEKQFILVLNSGSSSLKFSVFHFPSLTVLLHGAATALGSELAVLELNEGGAVEKIDIANASHKSAVSHLMEKLCDHKLTLNKLVAVGHRIVHGGEQFKTSTLIDENVLREIKKCSELAPLHNPANVLGIEAVLHLSPELPQIAVFDTAFHQTLPPQAYLYPVPYYLYTELGVRRYGFHGTSHRYVSQKAVEFLDLPKNDHQLLVAHLGNGCSASAIVNGQSRDTTMGLTPLEGMMMGTRCGDIDPGIHQFLQHQKGWDLDKITNMLNKESGLLGVSGVSNDMRDVCHAAEQGDANAQRAISLYCFKQARQLSSLAASLERIDALVFTGGVGEHQADIRQQIVAHLKVFNLHIDEPRNQQLGNEPRAIHTSQSPAIVVMPTDEESVIAQDCVTILKELSHA